MIDVLMDRLTLVLELIGTVAFALSGVLTGVKRELDVLGVVVVGSVTAVGGGVLRDILLGSLPPAMFVRPVYALVAIGTCIVAFTLLALCGPRSLARLERLNPVINVFDAVGLGVFSVVGVAASIRCGLGQNAFLSVFVGAVTGVGGGLMRDLLVGTVPVVLKKRVYALAALFGAVLYYMLVRLSARDEAAMLCGMGAVVLIRLLASRYRWDLPRIRLVAENAGPDAANAPDSARS